MKQKFEYDNSIAHLQGMYFCDALVAVLGNMFKDNTSNTEFEYPNEPYPLSQEEAEEQKQRRIEKQRELYISKLNTMFDNIDRTIKEKEKLKETNTKTDV